MPLSEKKPIIRWTCGAVSFLGLQCLRLAIENAQKIWGDLVDYVVTYNEWTRIPSVLRGLDVTFMDVTQELAKWYDISDMSGDLKKSGWLFSPLQIDSGRRQLTMDNDVVLVGTCEKIEDFLFGDDQFCLFLEFGKSGNKDAFNQAAHLVPEHIMKCDGGLLGIPDVCGLSDLVFEVARKNGFTPDFLRQTSWGWEQGVLSLFCNAVKDREVIKAERLPRPSFIVERDLTEYLDDKVGLHLSGVNQLYHGWKVKKFEWYKRQLTI